MISPWPINTPLLDAIANGPWQRWFSNLVVAVNRLLSGTKSGLGDPNGVVTGTLGDLYRNESGGAGASLWVKESGVATTTGWVAK